MSVFEQIKERLDAGGAIYTTEHHDAVYTSAEASAVRGTSMHQGAKALVVKGKKTGTFYLCVMPADLRLDSKKAKAVIGEVVGFASDPATVTGCVPGSVPPFGSVIGLKTFCDPRLAENEMITFNAGSLTDSINMKYVDYVRLEQPILADITS